MLVNIASASFVLQITYSCFFMLKPAISRTVPNVPKAYKINNFNVANYFIRPKWYICKT